MSKTYQALPTVSLQPGAGYSHSQTLPEIVHLDDPALDAMYDLSKSMALTINQNAPIYDARVEMKATGVHMLLAINDAQEVVGLISSEDILGEKPVKIIQEKHIARTDIKVSMVMTQQRHLLAIDKRELSLAKIADVIATLRAAKQHYALVVDIDSATQAQTVCGIFSLSSISRQLDKNVTDDLQARTLAELRHWLNSEHTH